MDSFDIYGNPDYDLTQGYAGQNVTDTQRALLQLEADTPTDSAFDNTGHNVTLGTSGGRTFADFTGSATLSQISDAGTMADKDVASAVANLTTLIAADLPVSNPPTKAEVEAIRDVVIQNRDKINAALSSLRTAVHIAT